MVCEFCGGDFEGRPIRQGDQVFCSIECANMAAQIGAEEDDYYEEDVLNLSSTDDDEIY